jgi:hypothetical protein
MKTHGSHWELKEIVHCSFSVFQGKYSLRDIVWILQGDTTIHFQIIICGRIVGENPFHRSESSRPYSNRHPKPLSKCLGVVRIRGETVASSLLQKQNDFPDNSATIFGRSEMICKSSNECATSSKALCRLSQIESPNICPKGNRILTEKSNLNVPEQSLRVRTENQNEFIRCIFTPN